MTRTDLTFALPCLLPSRSALPAAIACTIFEDEDRTILFVEAPNWSHAYDWGPLAALHAWGLLRDSVSRRNSWNPADVEHFFIYRLRPGFLIGDQPLWRESFTYYEASERSETMVQRLIPKPGTATVQELGPMSLASVFQETGVPPQNLQHFDTGARLMR